MQCRYCHQKPKTGSKTCTDCDLLVSYKDWDQLAHLWLFWHPEDWQADVAAFLELSHGTDCVPSANGAPHECFVRLTFEQAVIVRFALADAAAYRTPGEWCQDCLRIAGQPCCDHADDLRRQAAYADLHDRFNRLAFDGVNQQLAV